MSASVSAPSISYHHSGLMFGQLGKIDEILYTLASQLEYWETDKVEKLIESAKHDLTKGTSQPHPLGGELASKSLTGSYIAGRDVINDALAAQLPPVRRFMHNLGIRQSEPFMGTAIQINEIGDGKYVLVIDEGASRGNALETELAGALQLERAVSNVSVSFPLKKTHGGKNFRLDLAPYVEALRELGFTPSERFSVSTLDTKTVMEFFRLQIVNGGRFDLSPEFRLDCGVLGLVVTVGAYGCRFVTHDVFAEPPRQVYCEFDGSVITGPIEPKPDYSGGRGRKDSDELKDPIFSVTIRVDGPKTIEQQKTLHELPERIVDTVTAYLS